jgi:hypothetical protein
MRFDKWFILVGFISILCGMAFGEWMGATENTQLYPVHAHINLAGGVLMMLFGMMHRVYPSMGKARLALPQFLITTISIPFFAVGIYKVLKNHNDHMLVTISSMAFLLGVLLFLVMIVGKVLLAKDEA